MSDQSGHDGDIAGLHALIERHLAKELRLQVELARAEQAAAAASAAARKARHSLAGSPLRWDGF